MGQEAYILRGSRDSWLGDRADRFFTGCARGRGLFHGPVVCESTPTPLSCCGGTTHRATGSRSGATVI